MAPAPTNPTGTRTVRVRSDEDDDEARGAVDAARAARRCARRQDARARPREDARGDGDARHGDARHARDEQNREQAECRRTATTMQYAFDETTTSGASRRPCSVRASSRARSPDPSRLVDDSVFSVEMATERRALVVGGSGYLGQHLVDVLPRVPRVTCHYTYRDNALPADPSRVGCRADAITGEGMRGCSRRPRRGPPPTAPAPALLVVNCAATSSPPRASAIPLRARHQRPPLSSTPWTAWSAGEPAPPLLVHLGTDQVYGGDDAMSVEATHPPRPVNAYARSKTKAKVFRERWPKNRVSGSIITGADAPIRPVNRPLFLDFILGALRGDRPFSSATVEVPAAPARRRTRRVGVVASVVRPVGNVEREKHSTWVDRIGSRVDMARITARVFGLSDARRRGGPRSRATARRRTSRCSEALERETGGGR